MKKKKGKKKLLDAELEEKAKDLVGRGWIKSWMAFEVQATAKETATSALKEHIKKMKKENGVKILKENFTSVEKVEPPPQLVQAGVKELFSQVAEIVIMAQAFEVLVNTTINYGPSAVEILAPEELKLSMRDAQNSLASIADMMHKFAQAGLGGVMISPT